ncbi:hypothetical protein [Hymenobacter bucti]|uniref:Exo-alpha-sialidase n=1 Tax=Hymenobacter bucti TaxID=1844114 RepID=A0ABW4QR11_9BACT
MRKLLLYNLLGAVVLLSACKKEIEKIVVQDRQYSWMPDKGFTDSFGILLGAGKGPTGLYFQQPGGFAALQGPAAGPLRYTQYLSWGSGNLTTRYLIGPEFLATYRDTLVYLTANTQPVTSGAGGLIRLKKIDPKALYVEPNTASFISFAALSKNNYLLFPYESGRYDFKNRLVLAHITTTFGINFPIYTAQSKIIELPIVQGYNGYKPRLLTAIDDYFLVDCGSEGLFKVTEAGSFRQVLPANSEAYAFFKWQGALWAGLGNSKLATSTDNGDNWQVTAGGPDLRSTTVHLVGDSLVVMTHLYGGGRLYTLNLNLAKQKWHLRQLKDDGLNQTAINDLQTWGDTVYLATSSGLFKRSLRTFFESKPKP